MSRRSLGPTRGLLLAIFASGVMSRCAVCQELSPEESIAKMKVPAPFVVTTYVSEPLIRQPVSMEFDDRGRMWVIQYLQYPNPAGLKRTRVDRYSRTTYDRVPPPPPYGPRGADRITILLDEDGDGRAETGKDFVEGLNLATGLAFGHGGVFVLNVPYLLFYPDRDGDDTPDGDPEVLLSGFGMEDAHSVANSLTWGPDGWLYGCQGSTVTANIRGVEFQQGVWRYHPLTRDFELFCEGGGNCWGLDFDRHGNLFYSTNYGGNVMTHGVPGGYFWKSFGKHGALHNPYAYGNLEHVPHANFLGGHVTAGGVVYQGTAFPPEFRDRYLAVDLLGHGVYWHQVTPFGSSVRTAHGGELIASGDTWFAPCDATIGHDGLVYVADWHDRRTGHPDPDAEWDRTNGRVFRIAPKDAPATSFVAPNWRELSSDALVDLLADPNEWLARRASRILSERRDADVIPRLARQALDPGDQRRSIRSLWALATSGGFDETIAFRLLESPLADVRRWTTRFLGERKGVSPRMAERLDELCETDPEPSVRAELACACRRLPAAQALPILNGMLSRDIDSDDPYLPLLYWWGVEQHAVASPDQVLRRFTRLSAWTKGLIRGTILPRLIRRYASERNDAGITACLRLLASAPDAAARREAILAIDQGLRDTRSSLGGVDGTLLTAYAARSAEPLLAETTPSSAPAISSRIRDRLLEAISADAPGDPLVIGLAARLGESKAWDRVLAIALDRSASLETRLAMFAVLAESPRVEWAPKLLPVIGSGDEAEGGVFAVLARLDLPEISSRALEIYPKATADTKTRIRDLLFGRSAWTRKFLDRVESGEFDPKETPLDQLRRVAIHADPELDRLVRKHWGKLEGGTPEEKLAEVRRLSNDLRGGSGDKVRGKTLFTKHCATCHRLFDAGGKIGPDLTLANRADREYLLVSLVDPSAVIRKEFMSYVVQTTDGRSLVGLIVEQTPGGLTLLDAKNNRIAISQGEIAEMAEAPRSLMPDDLSKEFRPQDLRDLFAYLQGTGG